MKGSVDFYLKQSDLTLILLPQKALYIPQWDALLIADVHLGKAATFIRAGMAIPPYDLQVDLLRISILISETKCRQIIFLGDLFHHHTGMGTPEIMVLEQWRSMQPDFQITLIAGNHDRNTQQAEKILALDRMDFMERDGLRLTHFPEEKEERYNLAGHVHPVMQIQGKARQYRKLPCFCFGKNGGILPAFGALTGGGLVKPESDGQYFVIAGEKVLPFQPKV